MAFASDPLTRPLWRYWQRALVWQMARPLLRFRSWSDPSADAEPADGLPGLAAMTERLALIRRHCDTTG